MVRGKRRRQTMHIQHGQLFQSKPHYVKTPFVDFPNVLCSRFPLITIRIYLLKFGGCIFWPSGFGLMTGGRHFLVIYRTRCRLFASGRLMQIMMMFTVCMCRQCAARCAVHVVTQRKCTV